MVKGEGMAQNNLGYMYYFGQGVFKDYRAAASWYRRAAVQGVSKSQGLLAIMYDRGHGVIQDFLLAHMWSNIANANGNEKAGEYRDALAKEMTPQDISKAQAMARECMGSNYQNCGD